MLPNELFKQFQRTLVNPHEFDIQRKLHEAKVVYVSFARGGGKAETTRRNIEKLIAAGMDVKPARPVDQITVDAIKHAMIDLDILTPERMKRADDLLYDYMSDYIQKDLDQTLRPIIRPDAYIHDVPRQFLWDQMYFGTKDFIIVKEED